MSATIDQKAPLSPNDPAYYAPRVPRDADPSRVPPLGQTTRPARGLPATSITDTTLDGQLEKAVFDSLRHPLDPEAMDDPPETGTGILGMIGRVATAVGAAAFVALLFVIVIPSLRQQASEQSTSEVIDSMKAAFSRSEQAAKPPEAPPAEIKPIIATTEASAPVSHEESEALLKQFMQWQQKPEGQEKK